jgi:hypothetical protein
MRGKPAFQRARLLGWQVENGTQVPHYVMRTRLPLQSPFQAYNGRHFKPILTECQ